MNKNSIGIIELLNENKDLDRVILFEKYSGTNIPLECLKYNTDVNVLNEERIYSLAEREVFSYSKQGSINKILYSKEGSGECYLEFSKVFQEQNSNVIVYENWRFNPTIDTKPFIVQKTFIELILGGYNHKDLYRVKSCYKYILWGKERKKVTAKKKFIYDNDHPEQLKEIITYSIQRQNSLLNRVFLQFIVKYTIKFLNELLELHIMEMNEPYLGIKEIVRTNNNLPNKVIKNIKPSFPQIGMWEEMFTEEYYLHQTVLNEIPFNRKQSELENMVKNT